MTDETAVEMFVGGLVLDPNTQAPVVVLKDEKGEIHLPIWIGIAEATSIASAIKELNMARPLTHDLMADIFQELSVKVERMVITELKDSTYFAELILSFGDKALIFDARPSDAIAIALRATAPIYVTQQVIEQAQMAFSTEAGGEAPGAEMTDEQVASEEENPDQDFKNIDKDKWKEILDDLGADDFKYKM
ncbi:bifunctional nuclease family protein [Oligoflexia bacterium]|nr:bifunctional nuclease family protein [Oligoflexia bacterium]